MPATQSKASAKTSLAKKTLKRGFELMATAKSLTELYEANFKEVSQYVHATSRGHEAIQLAAGMQLKPQDYVYPYYRDDSILLGLGVTPEELMLQLLGKQTDPFSAGRTYYSHPSLRREGMPKIPHQSSATGMQAIPAAGAAMGLRYKKLQGLEDAANKDGIVVCSLGDASVTEGEVAEAFQMAVLKKLPILFLVQNNEWDISAHSDEVRAMDAVEYAAGFKGLSAKRIDGTDFVASYKAIEDIYQKIRAGEGPWLLQADVPLLNHHTSGVRSDFYRQAELEAERPRDPYPKLWEVMRAAGFSESELKKAEKESQDLVQADLDKARLAPDPTAETLFDHVFAPTPITEERGEREPEGGTTSNMVDSALHAVGEILEEYPEALLYGQDVGARLGGVFREAALLGRTHGDERVFNTPIVEAFIIGSTAGMSAVGAKPIVEVQFADYIWPGLNQLFTEVSRSCYLSAGKWPVQSLIRVPIGAYKHGGPYHSSSVESVLTAIRGIKIAYPSCAADIKGLLRAGFEDPNPVVMLEHKGLYWSKLPGTKAAIGIEPARGYALPFGVARTVLAADVDEEATLGIVTYGMGVYWAIEAAKQYKGKVEILDLRTLSPIDEEAIYTLARKHHRILVVTEEPVMHSFAQALAGRIQETCFSHLDAPVRTLGAEEIPATPLNWNQEQAYLPNKDKVAVAIGSMLEY
ncbi:MAG: thiamine pyrophosphate-dependent enzyme [Saprospiraceae bacterium]